MLNSRREGAGRTKRIQQKFACLEPKWHYAIWTHVENVITQASLCSSQIRPLNQVGRCVVIRFVGQTADLKVNNQPPRTKLTSKSV